MEITSKFFIEVDEAGKKRPMISFFSPKYDMLSHLGYERFSKSVNVKDEIVKIKSAYDFNTVYSFAADDWCIVDVKGAICIVSNGFDEFDPFEINTKFILETMEGWCSFLIKYENNSIPGLSS